MATRVKRIHVYVDYGFEVEDKDPANTSTDEAVLTEQVWFLVHDGAFGVVPEKTEFFDLKEEEPN